MGTNLLGELAANNGTYYLNAGNFSSTYTGAVDQIIIRGSNIQIETIEVRRNGEWIDVTSDYLSTNVLPDGVRITPKNDEVFNRITIVGAGGFGGVELVLAA
jgi:hypothetical protein